MTHEPGSEEPSDLSANEGPAVPSGSERPVVVDRDCPEHLERLPVRCVVVTVPINRAAPAAGSTQVSVVIHSGYAGKRRLPLAVLAGGPGSASSDLAQYLPSQPYAQVFIDQRGVGFGSADFYCAEWEAVLTDVFKATGDEAEAIADQARARCSEQMHRDPVFAHTTTEAHAADVVDVMAALGYGRWLLYGVSYGTTIALEVMRSAPEGLVGAVLDGVYPGHLDHDTTLAAGAQRVIRELDENCRLDLGCSAMLADSPGEQVRSLAELLA